MAWVYNFSNQSIRKNQLFLEENFSHCSIDRMIGNKISTTKQLTHFVLRLLLSNQRNWDLFREWNYNGHLIYRQGNLPLKILPGTPNCFWYFNVFCLLPFLRRLLSCYFQFTAFFFLFAFWNVWNVERIYFQT